MHHLTSASSTKTTTSRIYTNDSNEKTIRHTILNSNSTVMSRYLPLRTQICRANKLMVGRWSFPNILPFQGGKIVDLQGFREPLGRCDFCHHQAPLGDAPALCRAQTAMALGGAVKSRKLVWDIWKWHGESTVYLTPLETNMTGKSPFLFEIGDTSLFMADFPLTS